MARVFEDAMRGYAFVDNIKRQHRSDERLATLQKREDSLYNRQQAEYEKRQQEQRAVQAGVGKLVSMSTLSGNDKVINTYNEINQTLSNPEAIKSLPMDKVTSWGNVLFGSELEARAAKYGGKNPRLTGGAISPDGKGLFFEMTYTDKNGKEVTAPLTDGATSVDEPNSGQHKVQYFPVSTLAEKAHQAYITAEQIRNGKLTDVLKGLAENGGNAGMQIAQKYAQSMASARANATATISKRAWEIKKLLTEEQGKNKRNYENNATKIMLADKKFSQKLKDSLAKSGKTKISWKSIKDENGNVVEYDPNNPGQKILVNLSEAKYNELLSEAQRLAKEQADEMKHFYVSDRRTFKDYGGSYEKAVQAFTANNLINAKDDYIHSRGWISPEEYQPESSVSNNNADLGQFRTDRNIAVSNQMLAGHNPNRPQQQLPPDAQQGQQGQAPQQPQTTTDEFGNSLQPDPNRPQQQLPPDAQQGQPIGQAIQEWIDKDVQGALVKIVSYVKDPAKIADILNKTFPRRKPITGAEAIEIMRQLIPDRWDGFKGLNPANWKKY